MAVTKVINIQANTKEAQKNVEELNEELRDTKKGTEEVGKATDQVTGGMIGKFKGLMSSVGGVIKSFGLLKTAIIATGLGALLVAIVSIKQAFTSSEEGQNRWAKIMQYVGTIVGNVTDILAEMGNLLIWVFTHPKEALESFAKLIKDQIVNRFTGLLELIPNLGKAIQKLFSGEFKEAAKIATNAVSKVALGVEDMTGKINAAADATREFIKEQERELKIAGQIADQRAKADKVERALITERAKADRDIAELREKAELRDQYNVNQRIKFLKQASEIEDAIAKKEIEAAKLRRDALIEENRLSKSNKEQLKAEEEAKARVIELETASLRARKRLTTQIQSFTREEASIAKAAEAEKKRIQDEADKAEAERLKKEQSLKDKIDKEKRDALNAQLQAQEEYDKIYRENTLTKQQLELEAVDEKYFELIAKAEEYGYDITELERRQAEEKTKINDEYRKSEQEKEQKLQDAKTQIISDSLGGLNNLIGAFTGENEKQQKKAFELQKAVSIAQTIIDTYKGAQAIFASAAANPSTVLFPAQPFITAGLAVAAGLANVKKIASTQFNSRSASGGSTPTPSTPNATQQLASPNFNVVGASGVSQTESLAPVKAYVVSGDVTTAQALDRNRINNATF